MKHMYTNRPVLVTRRLILRPFVIEDAADVQRLAGDKRVADSLALVPHPYPDGEAERWIATHEENFHSGVHLTFAVTDRESGELLGSISLHPKPDQLRSEVGYWLGVPFWGKGFATDALRSVIRYAFTETTLQRIYAAHFATNPASGRVMQKAGMKFEGVMRLGASRFGELHDAVLYAIVKPDWRQDEDE